MFGLVGQGLWAREFKKEFYLYSVVVLFLTDVIFLFNLNSFNISDKVLILHVSINKLNQ